MVSRRGARDDNAKNVPLSRRDPTQIQTRSRWDHTRNPDDRSWILVEYRNAVVAALGLIGQEWEEGALSQSRRSLAVELIFALVPVCVLLCPSLLADCQVRQLEGYW